MSESIAKRLEGQMPKKPPSNGKLQLNIWISEDVKRYLDDRSEQEDRHRYELIEELIRKDMAVHHGESVEQHSLPVISEIIETRLRKATAQLRTDLREDMQLEIIEQIKTITRNSDNRLASLIVRVVRDSGIIRRLLYALVAKTHGAVFATEAYESAREKAGQELASRITAKKEAD
jgi:gamma-glutamylcysteine synthetase